MSKSTSRLLSTQSQQSGRSRSSKSTAASKSKSSSSNSYYLSTKCSFVSFSCKLLSISSGGLDSSLMSSDEDANILSESVRKQTLQKYGGVKAPNLPDGELCSKIYT